eukprot:8364792-Karenia_brevis.AAC.1
MPVSLPRRPSRVARCQRCQRHLPQSFFYCNECWRVFCRYCVTRTSTSTFVCEDCRDSDSDVHMPMSGG